MLPTDFTQFISRSKKNQQKADAEAADEKQNRNSASYPCKQKTAAKKQQLHKL
jgi:hypothetical protein